VIRFSRIVGAHHQFIQASALVVLLRKARSTCLGKMASSTTCLKSVDSGAETMTLATSVTADKTRFVRENCAAAISLSGVPGLARDRVTDRNTKRQSNAFKPLYHACSWSMGDQKDGSSGSDVVTVWRRIRTSEVSLAVIATTVLHPERSRFIVPILLSSYKARYSGADRQTAAGADDELRRFASPSHRRDRWF
jgi:hypothetical protein